MASDANLEEVLDRFQYHEPKSNDKKRLHNEIRHFHAEVADFLMDALPDSREKSLALTALQESMMWANACAAYQIKQF